MTHDIQTQYYGLTQCIKKKKKKTPGRVESAWLIIIFHRHAARLTSDHNFFAFDYSIIFWFVQCKSNHVCRLGAIIIYEHGPYEK